MVTFGPGGNFGDGASTGCKVGDQDADEYDPFGPRGPRDGSGSPHHLRHPLPEGTDGDRVRFLLFPLRQRSRPDEPLQDPTRTPADIRTAREQERPVPVLDVETQNALIAACPPRVQYLMLMAIATGCRIGELLEGCRDDPAVEEGEDVDDRPPVSSSRRARRSGVPLPDVGRWRALTAEPA